ncbi:serine hydrolase domain-containing protein [Pedobacter punctiformis]|uniref:Serine hydrolase n=1 Tax=Pedobacter punctiformis TaxID=3004097 RepID=A0ABT4L432_9SPHI|nr:serine hydrolase domain-containing protein [Pedobacter sp. HCMS5-2]MCZ4242671.1 serine hydrolase [Pedobacter sp. HCMS5-2]
MKSLKFTFLLLIAVNFCNAQTKNKEKQLDSIFTILYKQNQFNGTVLIADKGKVVFKKGYGYRDENSKALNSSTTIFELGSCSKQFTAMGILLLAKQGKLSYNDQLSKYIPELSFWNDVTIYNLLRHTSGVPEYLDAMRKEWDSTKIATNKDLINFYAKRKDTLNFKPNTNHRYCNTNYALLASIIERVSGEDYATFLKENIFVPLGMKNTFVYNRRQSPRKITNYAIGYVWARDSFKKVTSENPGYDEKMVYYLDGIVGSAKVNSTAEDLLKWINALKSNSFISAEDFNQMTEITKTTKGKNIPYGFGLDVSKGENKFSFGHTGSWDGYASFIYHNMPKDRTIIILQNFKMGTYSFNNISQILDNKPVVTEYRSKINIPQSEMEKYAGTYLDEKDKEEAHILTYKNGHLFYNTPKVKWDMRFFPVSANEFSRISQGGVDGILKFTKLENGDTKLEMLQYGNVIGTGIKSK